jgi:hypothetical protein
MYTVDEVEKIIKLEEQRYVTNGLPDTVPEIDWIEF